MVILDTKISKPLSSLLLLKVANFVQFLYKMWEESTRKFTSGAH